MIDLLIFFYCCILDCSITLLSKPSENYDQNVSFTGITVYTYVKPLKKFVLYNTCIFWFKMKSVCTDKCLPSVVYTCIHIV